jgi:hypothetical protein
MTPNIEHALAELKDQRERINSIIQGLEALYCLPGDASTGRAPRGAAQSAKPGNIDGRRSFCARVRDAVAGMGTTEFRNDDVVAALAKESGLPVNTTRLAGAMIALRKSGVVVGLRKEGASWVYSRQP